MEIKEIGIGVIITLIVVGAVIYLPGYIKGSQVTITAFTRYANLSSVNLTNANIVIQSYQIQVPFEVITSNGIVYSSNMTSFAGAVNVKYPNDNFVIKVGLGDSAWKSNAIIVNKTSINGNKEISVYLIPSSCTYTINTTNFCTNNYFLK